MSHHERRFTNGRRPEQPEGIRINPVVLAEAEAKRVHVRVEGQLSNEQTEFFRRTISYLCNASDQAAQSLGSKIKKDPHYSEKDPDGVIWDMLQKKQLLRPTFTVLDYVAVKPVLKEYKLDDPYSSDKAVEQRTIDEAFVILELPKPLSQWWNKGTGNWGDRGVDLDEMVIQWGKYYREAMPTLWRLIPPHQRIGKYEVDIDRLNPTEVHKAHEFYNIYHFRSDEYVVRPRPEFKGVTAFRVAYEQARHELKMKRKRGL